MTIAIDAGDMDAIRQRLREASQEIGGAVPRLPGSAAFGPAVLGAAVTSFESVVRQQARDLQDQWSGLEAGVRGTFDDMSAVETEIIAAIQRLSGRLG